jgi:hypothetical protein
LADDGTPGGNKYCTEPKPFRAVAQDETRTISELCMWRDDSLRLGADRKTPLAQDEPPAAKINLSIEQRHVIKEIVLKDLKQKRMTADVAISVGDAVPAGVDVTPFPPAVYGSVPPVKSHGFFVKDDYVIVANPEDNTIADVIDWQCPGQ